MLTKEDFSSDQETRWCPGCGDYAILATVQALMPELGVPPEQTVFVSGIGCAGRFVYYMDTYGVHGIHGRAPALATGLATARPDLSIWVVYRRRRRALDRRQPPDPRAAPQRADQDPALQQPDLRPDEGPVLAHERDRQGHQVDAVRLTGPPVQPGRAGARRRGDVRRAHRRHRPQARRPRCCARPPSTRARPSSRSTRTATSSTTAPSTPCATRTRRRRTRSRSSTASRSASAQDGERGVVRGPTAAWRSSTSRTSARTRWSCTTSTAHDPSLAFALAHLAERPTGPTPIGVFRSVERPVYGEQLGRELEESRDKVGKQQLEALLHSGDTWTVE